MTTLSSLYGKGLVSDVAYPTGWDGETDIAPSKNVVYDEMETKADKGINADITSMTGLDNDGIPVEKIDSGIERAILGDATKGRVLRISILEIYDGTNANTLKCELKNSFNGDTIAQTDNVAKNATTGDFTLDATGQFLKIENSGLSGTVLGVSGINFVNVTGITAINPLVLQIGGDIQLQVHTDQSGTRLDLTTIVTSYMQLYITYITAA